MARLQFDDHFPQANDNQVWTSLKLSEVIPKNIPFPALQINNSFSSSRMLLP